MTTHKDDILRLRAEGKSYRTIAKELGCAKSTVAYHCSEGEKEKSLARKKRDPYLGLRRKIDSWKRSVPGERKEFQQSPKSHEWKVREKVRRFQMKSKTDTAPILEWTAADLQEKIKNVQSCYLTGRPVDINNYTTFQLDHIEPRSAGGDNSLDNLGVTTPQANYAKGALPLEDFLALCIDVVVHWDIVDANDIKL